jgi:hypothetical protein
MADKNLINKVEQLAEIARKRQRRLLEEKQENAKEKKVVPDAQVASTGKIIRLPIWPDEVRGAPNAVLRSALFSSIQGKNRKEYKTKTKVASISGITISFKGTRLDQTDLDVWEMAVHLARKYITGTKAPFKANEFLRALGKANSGQNHKWLKEIFWRLTACGVEIKTSRYTYMGNMLHQAYWDEKTKRFWLCVNEDLAKLFNTGWTSIYWEQRRKLSRKPLALWLHGFYISYEQPYPMKPETLHGLCGSENKSIRGFKQELGNALKALKDIGAIEDFEIKPGKDGLVHIYKTKSLAEE